MGPAHRSRMRQRRSRRRVSDRPSASIARSQSVLVEPLIDDDDIHALSRRVVLALEVIDTKQLLGPRSIGENRIGRVPDTPMIRRRKYEVGTAACKNILLLGGCSCRYDIVNHLVAADLAAAIYVERNHDLVRPGRFRQPLDARVDIVRRPRDGSEGRIGSYRSFIYMLGDIQPGPLIGRGGIRVEIIGNNAFGVRPQHDVMPDRVLRHCLSLPLWPGQVTRPPWLRPSSKSIPCN